MKQRTALVPRKRGYKIRQQNSIGKDWSPRYSRALAAKPKAAFKPIKRYRTAEDLYYYRRRGAEWKFKLYRDDDTTIRDAAGNITTPSGLALDIWSFGGIFIHDGVDVSAGLPSIREEYSSYWSYNSETSIWTYDDSADWPDYWYKGTYNENTGVFTIQHQKENKSVDDLYWVYYSTAEPTAITDPAVNEAVSTSKVDGYIGIVISLSEAGNSQTLQAPTDITAGRTFIIKVSGIKSEYTDPDYAITINGVVLSQGESQGFIWNGENWEISDATLLYGLNTQYPYRYKTADKEQIADKISLGSYESNIPYWEIGDMAINPKPILREGNNSFCDEFNPGELHLRPKETAVYGSEFFDTFFNAYNNIKTSIPYKTWYHASIVYSVIGAWGYGKLYLSDPCDGILKCANFYDCPGSIGRSISLASGDGIVNEQGVAFNFTGISDWKERPSSVEIDDISNIKVTNLKETGYCYLCNPEGPELLEYIPSDLVYIVTRGYCEPVSSSYGIKINFQYE